MWRALIVRNIAGYRGGRWFGNLCRSYTGRCSLANGVIEGAAVCRDAITTIAVLADKV